jgi:hypothetical protein
MHYYKYTNNGTDTNEFRVEPYKESWLFTLTQASQDLGTRTQQLLLTSENLQQIKAMFNAIQN